MRTEKDSLGQKQIPDDVYYGIQTIRAVENFPISGLKAHPRFIDAYVLVKKAAAIANARCGTLPAALEQAIVKACDEILAGSLRDQFPVDVFQMGAGTSFHMNLNEVLANRANELLGQRKGVYDPIHPNDHVNMAQSTNDTFPTAMRIAAVLILRESLYGSMLSLEKSLTAKGKHFDGILKSARTHLQDAVPIRLGQEFMAYAECLKRSRNAIVQAEKSLMELGIGGSAAGTGINTPADYQKYFIEGLNELTGRLFIPAADLREAMQSQGPIAQLSSALKNLCLELTRICNDLRLLSSGPTTGLCEISLPACAPGSSIMPGKINPSVLEMTNMVSYQVIGIDATVSYAVSAGQLELNVMMPLMAYNLNFAITILGNAIKIMNDKCVQGIEANKGRCKFYAETSLGLATALNPVIGYAKAAEVAKEAQATGKTVLEIIRSRKILTETQIQQVMDPNRMTEPGVPGA